MPRWAIVILVIIVLLVVVNNPAGAGHFVNSVIGGIGTFFNSLHLFN